MQGDAGAAPLDALAHTDAPAVGADHETATHLGLADGAPCLRLERRTWRDGQGVTWAWQTFPGAAYDLVARFSPTKG